MLKFAGIKSRAEVLKQCKAQGVKVDLHAYNAGSDYTFLRKGGCAVAWNSSNGNFMGKTPDGVEFSNESAKHDKEPWMQALLNFFYVSK